MVLPVDFRAFLQSLNRRRVRFIIIGAHALAAHGRPRYTGDLDVLIEPTSLNAKRVIAALEDFGFGALAISASELAAPGIVVRLGRPPVAIDLLTKISGVSFDAAWRGRLRARLDDLAVSFLGRKEYVRNKRAADRPKDRADLALLAEQRGIARTRPRSAR
jgi:hypothetical protein